MNLHTFVVHVEDKPGVLNRVASLFRRRGFNIESLTVGHTETPGVSRMTIVVDADEVGARRVEANLYKLVNVLRVDDVTRRPSVDARPGADQGHGDARDARRRSCSSSTVFRARIVDVSPRVADRRDHRQPRTRSTACVEVLRAATACSRWCAPAASRCAAATRAAARPTTRSRRAGDDHARRGVIAYSV